MRVLLLVLFLSGCSSAPNCVPVEERQVIEGFII